MKLAKIIYISLTVAFSSLALSGCENTSVSGHMSYGMNMGYGYPMYYGPRGHHHHTDIVVVKPPRKERSRPSKPKSRPSRGKKR